MNSALGGVLAAEDGGESQLENGFPIFTPS
jgi:hypothetical protein